MANDRLWLRCSECGERILLFKYYPLGKGYVYHPMKKLERFLNSHFYRCYNTPLTLSDNAVELVNERQLYKLEGKVSPSGNEGD